MKTGFDNALYVQKQSRHILERVEKFGNRLYLEFGGKLFDDCHAARVLPGFDVNGKVKLLMKLKEKAEIIFCISAHDIERNKMRADYGITYGAEVMRVIDKLRDCDLLVSAIVITQYAGQPVCDMFKNKLENRGEKVYIHRYTKGYPNDVDTIVSEEGYGLNPYIPTSRPLVVVTAPGPGSGKLATCLSQLYHESKRGTAAGFAKFETFPIWNIPLKHPVNVAYEAATADLNDVNMIDYFHLEAYGKQAVSYNRDLEVFPVLKNILKKISGKDLYQSPTDMGVNMAGYAIADNDLVCEAAKQEVIRRYFHALCDRAEGTASVKTVERLEGLMRDLNISPLRRNVVSAANERSTQVHSPVVAIQLENGKIVTGKQSNLLSAGSSALLNAVKTLAGLSDEIKLISPEVIAPIIDLNKNVLKNKKEILSMEETLVALSISAASDKNAQTAFKAIKQLRECQAHSSHVVSGSDKVLFGKLGVNLTCDPRFATLELYSE